MKKILKYKKGEPLYKWIDRIADYLRFDEELKEVLTEVSKTSYIKGSNDAQQIFFKRK